MKTFVFEKIGKFRNSSRRNLRSIWWLMVAYSRFKIDWGWFMLAAVWSTYISIYIWLLGIIVPKRLTKYEASVKVPEGQFFLEFFWFTRQAQIFKKLLFSQRNFKFDFQFQSLEKHNHFDWHVSHTAMLDRCAYIYGRKHIMEFH